MNNTVPNPNPHPAAYINMHTNGVLDTRWADHIGRVVIDTAGIAIHLDPESAAQLAADLISAVAESGAGQVPDVLLGAFGQHADATHSIRYAVAELEQHDADCLGSASAVGRLRAALREAGEPR